MGFVTSELREENDEVLQNELDKHYTDGNTNSDGSLKDRFKDVIPAVSIDRSWGTLLKHWNLIGNAPALNDGGVGLRLNRGGSVAGSIDAWAGGGHQNVEERYRHKTSSYGSDEQHVLNEDSQPSGAPGYVLVLPDNFSGFGVATFNFDVLAAEE